MSVFRALVLTGPAITMAAIPVMAFTWSSAGPTGNTELPNFFEHPTTQLRRIMADVSGIEAESTRKALDQAKVKLQGAPLEAAPFVLAARINYSDGSYADAARFAAIARRRNPQSRDARLVAADVALANGDIANAVEDLEAVLRFAPTQALLVEDVIVLLTSHPEVGSTALAALTDNRLKIKALVALAQSGASARKMSEAFRLTNAKVALEANPEAINAITQPFVTAGDLKSAYSVWAELVAGAPNRPDLGPNGRFVADLPPPFGWDIPRSSDGFASLQPNGLVGETYARRNATLARQLLTLAPGRYRIEVEALVANDQLEVAISCLPSTEISMMRLNRAGILEAPLQVDPQCKGQRLEIRAKATDTLSPSPFHIGSIKFIRSQR